MKLMNLKRGDWLGGVVMFGIMFTIALISLFVVKKIQATQAKGLFQPGMGIGGGGALGGIGFGTIGRQLANCDELHKGEQKKIDKCKTAVRSAIQTGGGSFLSPEEKLLLTQSKS